MSFIGEHNDLRWGRNPHVIVITGQLFQDVKQMMKTEKSDCGLTGEWCRDWKTLYLALGGGHVVHAFIK